MRAVQWVKGSHEDGLMGKEVAEGQSDRQRGRIRAV